MKLVPPIIAPMPVVINTYVLGMFIDMSRMVTAYVRIFDLICLIAIVLAVVADRSGSRFIGASTIVWLATTSTWEPRKATITKVVGCMSATIGSAGCRGPARPCGIA